jgi:type III restriction enzyme
MLSRPISTYTIDDELISYTYEQEQDTSFYFFDPDLVYASYSANNLKKEQFPKSPVVIYNHCFVKGVIESAYLLRQQLELEATTAHNNGEPYIRPMALFVVNGENASQDLTLYELKMKFIEAGIKKTEIKIKGNVIDELQGLDVMKNDCEVRYVITVNDLQEQWRCPFVYVLASLERRAFAMDILTPVNCFASHPSSSTSTRSLLNAGYILTASSKFSEMIASLRTHFQDMGIADTAIHIKDNLIELLKHISVFEILRGEINNGMEGIDLKKKLKNDNVVKEIQQMILGSSS